MERNPSRASNPPWLPEPPVPPPVRGSGGGPDPDGLALPTLGLLLPALVLGGGTGPPPVLGCPTLGLLLPAFVFVAGVAVAAGAFADLT